MTDSEILDSLDVVVREMKMSISHERLCCCIPDQTKLDDGCQNLAEYQIWMGNNPTSADFTESCAKHLEEMLDDSVKFVVLRIPQAA